MAEETHDLSGLPKRQAYSELAKQLDSILDGVDDPIAEMASVSSLVHHAFRYLWTGFYRVVTPGKLLRVGPYQGTLGCLEIAFGKGVCGTAAQTGEVVIIRDVEKFPGHISCDGRAKSEIVLPVVNENEELIAVLDVDSDRLGAFDEEDAHGLGLLLERFAIPRSP